MSAVGFVLTPVKGAVRVITALPRVVDAILVLPRLTEQLDQVNGNTDALPDILGELRSVQTDTACLPGVHDELAVMRKEIEEMRATLAQVERNTLAVEMLAETFLPLQGAAVRVGRLADRLPQRRIERGH